MNTEWKFIVTGFAFARRQLGLQFVQGLCFWYESDLYGDAGRLTVPYQGPLRLPAHRWNERRWLCVGGAVAPPTRRRLRSFPPMSQ